MRVRGHIVILKLLIRRCFRIIFVLRGKVIGESFSGMLDRMLSIELIRDFFSRLAALFIGIIGELPACVYLFAKFGVQFSVHCFYIPSF